MTTITHHDVLVSKSMDDLAERFVLCTDAGQYDLANEIYFAMYAQAVRRLTGEYWVPTTHPSYYGIASDNRSAHTICDVYIRDAWDNR